MKTCTSTGRKQGPTSTRCPETHLIAPTRALTTLENPLARSQCLHSMEAPSPRKGTCSKGRDSRRVPIRTWWGSTLSILSSALQPTGPKLWRTTQAGRTSPLPAPASGSIEVKSRRYSTRECSASTSALAWRAALAICPNSTRPSSIGQDLNFSSRMASETRQGPWATAHWPTATDSRIEEGPGQWPGERRSQGWRALATYHVDLARPSAIRRAHPHLENPSGWKACRAGRSQRPLCWPSTEEAEVHQQQGWARCPWNMRK